MDVIGVLFFFFYLEDVVRLAGREMKSHEERSHAQEARWCYYQQVGELGLKDKCDLWTTKDARDIIEDWTESKPQGSYKGRMSPLCCFVTGSLTEELWRCHLS